MSGMPAGSTSRSMLGTEPAALPSLINFEHSRNEASLPTACPVGDWAGGGGSQQTARDALASAWHVGVRGDDQPRRGSVVKEVQMGSRRWGPTVWLRIVLVYLFCGGLTYLILRSEGDHPLMFTALVFAGIAGGAGAIAKATDHRRR